MQKVKVKMQSACPPNKFFGRRDRAKVKKICVLICHFVPDLIRDLPLIFNFLYCLGFRVSHSGLAI